MWNPHGEDPRPFMLHRKMWEWLFIAQALAERDMLRPGRVGLGFGVGRGGRFSGLADAGYGRRQNEGGCGDEAECKYRGLSATACSLRSR